mmetsp:Transcript_4626/g.7282  ORF Transcript_4626/g.7282 Transcript_4626/m.7282 type:complete len:286 (-) Transcript_4626:25-882(-)
MPVQEGLVDGQQRGLPGHADGEGGEVALQPRVDLEGARRGVHAGHHLRVRDVAHAHLHQVVHVPVLHLLPQQRDRALRVVHVHLGQVEVVHEVDQALVARRAVVRARLLLQREEHGVLQHGRGGVEVEVDGGAQHLVRVLLLQQAVDHLRLARARRAGQHDGLAHAHQQLHPEGDRARLRGGHRHLRHGRGALVLDGVEVGALVPLVEGAVLRVQPVVEDRVAAGELHALELALPVLAEHLAVVRAVVGQRQRGPQRPDQAEHKDNVQLLRVRRVLGREQPVQHE